MAAMAGGRAAASRKHGSSGHTMDSGRLAAARAKAREEILVSEMFDKHDTDQSNSLHAGQLKAFLQDFVVTKAGYEEKVVSDEEVTYVMSIADSLNDGEVEKADIKVAVATWTALLSDQALIDGAFDRYDTDKSGKLDGKQVERLLTDLNGKEPVSAEDVQYVIEMSDGKGDAKDGQLARAEVKVAVAVWYTRVEEKSKKSSACSIL